jgi:hypothetical protein
LGQSLIERTLIEHSNNFVGSCARRGKRGTLRNVNVMSSLSTDLFGNSPFPESVLGCHLCGEQHPMSEDDKHDDENPDLGSLKHHRVEPPDIGLFVTDKEMYRRLGVGPKTGRSAAKALEPHGFPIKQPLFGNRRYWPAVRLFLDRYYRLVDGPRVDRPSIFSPGRHLRDGS